jgi:hypothetical protein
VDWKRNIDLNFEYGYYSEHYHKKSSNSSTKDE